MRKKLHYIIIHYHELSLLLRVEHVQDWFSLRRRFFWEKYVLLGASASKHTQHIRINTLSHLSELLCFPLDVVHLSAAQWRSSSRVCWVRR